MKTRTTTLASTALAAGVLLAVAVPMSASAHVSVAPTSTAAGSYSVLTFALAHGCDGSATTSIAIDIPESITSVSPTVNPNWDVEKVAVDLAEPLDDGHGNTITTRTGQIVYTAKAPLADGLRDTFELSVPLPADAAGTTISFPVLQTCEVGVTNWNEVQKDGEAEPELPAPSITVTEAVADAHGHGAAAASDDDEVAASGEHAADGAGSGAAGSDDVIARVLGIGGLAVGVVGIVLAITARRKQSA
ncbi:YcnI family protein [Leifsonia sp. A12D58]|uniref:YcnI family copper-binding membrane protein n=1 Tax=Leifsonia sp. A12D58 TaxID=3397674 RepID=UPI0039E1E888